MTASLSVDERIKQLREFRDQYKQTLEEKIAALKKEREELDAQYADEIGQVESELKLLGVNVGEQRPTDLAIKAYNFLKENAGKKFRGMHLTQAIHAHGAVPSVLLAPFIQDGRVKNEGSYRSKVYWVDNEESQ